MNGKPLYFALAALSFALAVAGLFLPILPTTPFLLLTSWCLLRCSPRLNERLRRTAVFGPLLRDWDQHHGVRMHVKVTAVASVVLVVAASAVLGDLPPALLALLVALAAIGVAVVLRLPTVRD